MDRHQESYKSAINRFNNFIGPSYQFNEFQHRTHNSLLDLMDKKQFILYQSEASPMDMARIYSVSNNGAMSWTNVVYNWELPRRLSNQQMFIAISLVTGLPIFPIENLSCLRCKSDMDIFGHHCLSCPNTDYLYRRHDRIIDILYYYAKSAGFDVYREAKYHKIDGVWIRRKSRPGDLCITNWPMEKDENGFIRYDSRYFDLSIGNVFCKSYIRNTAMERLYLAKLKEKEKSKKYGDKDDIFGLGFECLGGMSPNLKGLLQEIAEQLEMRTETTRAIWMNKMRSRIMMELIYHNTLMAQQCYNLFAVQDNIDEMLYENDDDI